MGTERGRRMGKCCIDGENMRGRGTERRRRRRSRRRTLNSGQDGVTSGSKEVSSSTYTLRSKCLLVSPPRLRRVHQRNSESDSSKSSDRHRCGHLNSDPSASQPLFLPLISLAVTVQ
jgi:hypothetical protein